MAVRKVVCSDCGGLLDPGDIACPHCGAVIESEGPRRTEAAVPSTVTVHQCHVCGHENRTTGAYCESCGARLLSSPQPAKGPGKGSHQQREKKRPAIRLERWQLFASAGLIILVGFFVYTEITKERPKVQEHVHQNLSAEATAAIQEIEQLQQAVNDNPNDATSRLRLANLLHDYSQQDARLLFRALDAYKSYLALNPSNPDARVDLGIVYFELARVDSTNSRQLIGRALEEMQAVARARPDHQSAAFNLGIVNLFAGNSAESSRWFHKAIDINPESDLGNRAKRLLEQHSFQSPVN